MKDNRKLEKYLSLLGVQNKDRNEYVPGKVIIALDDSNDFSRLYTKLDNMDVELEESGLSMKEEESIFIYSNKDFKFVLEGNFIRDEYSITLQEQ